MRQLPSGFTHHLQHSLKQFAEAEFPQSLPLPARHPRRARGAPGCF
jgi:hypothetical protein